MEWIEPQTDEQMDEWMDERMDKWMMVDKMNEWTNASIIYLMNVSDTSDIDGWFKV